MKVRCERDNTVFTATIVPYPTAAKQSTHYDISGDAYIECPTCGRRYFMESETNGFGDKMDHPGVWHSDRPLTILG